MTDSELKTLIDCLGAERATLVRHLNDWTWVVALGVLCEVIFILWDHWDDHADWRYGRTHFKIRFPSKPSITKLICEVASVVVVVAGIVGELRVEAELGKVDSDLQDANDRRVQLLRGESDKQRLRAVCLDRQLQQLWISILPRKIDEVRFKTNMGDIGDIKFAVANDGSPEARNFSQSLERVLAAGEFPFEFSRRPASLPLAGVWIEVINPSPRLNVIALRTQKALKEEGIDALFRIPTQQETDLGPMGKEARMYLTNPSREGDSE